MLRKRLSYFFKKNFIHVEDEIWPVVQFRLLIENVFKVKTACVIGLVFMLFLLVLDYKRYSEHKIIIGNIYWYLFLTHISLITLVIPLMLIEWKKEKIRAGTYPYSSEIIMVWMAIIAIDLMLMAAFSILERGSIAMYILYIILMNFVLTLFHSDRAMLNILSLLVFMIAVYIVHPQIDERYLTIFFEALSITFIAFSLSTHIFNMMVKEVISEQVLLDKNRQIEEARAKSQELLLNILPASVAEELIRDGKVQPRNYQSATVMMIDFVGFSKISKGMSSEELVKNLDYCFRNFDRIIKSFGVEKIKTIGDGYLCVGGLPEVTKDHPEKVIQAAFGILAFLETYKKEQLEKKQPFFEGRIGIHTGSLTAGVVGETKFAYDIWGDTVNIAARLEAGGEVAKVNISKATKALIEGQFETIYRGELPIKNMGNIDMYFAQLKSA